MWRHTKTLMVVLALLGASSCLWADFLNLPADTPITMKFTNWDVGNQYNVANGSYTKAQLDAYTATYGGQAANANAGEDAWGIFALKEIDVPGQILPFWSRAASGTEITGIFWGIQDYSLDQSGSGTDVQQVIRSTGLKFAFYYDTSPDFLTISGPSTRQLDGTTYLPFFNKVTDGQLLWTGHSVPGFVTNGTVVDPVAEFTTTYNTTTHNVQNGGFYADVSPVTYKDNGGVTHTLTGQDNDQWALWTPGNPSYPTNFQFQFTGTGATSAEKGWLVVSEDPVMGLSTKATPELPSSALLLLGLAPIGLARMRRKNA